MATTANYGWTTPDDTGYVKDGALAIRTLGSAIDTTVDSIDDRVDTLEANDIPKTLIDAKGDLLAGTAADTVNRLAVGTNGQILTADSSTATGLKWATPSSTASGLTLITANTISGSSTVNVNNCFSNTYENYRIVIAAQMSSVANFRIRMRASGTDATASNYYQQVITGNGTAVTAGRNTYDGFYISSAGSDTDYSFITIDIMRPFVAAETAFTSLAVTRPGGTNIVITYDGGGHAADTSYDGFTLFTGGLATITGTMRVYGYQNS